jgi:hypothetical protein
MLGSTGVSNRCELVSYIGKPGQPEVLQDLSQPTKGPGTLRRAVRRQAFAKILGGRHMECAYYFDFGRLCSCHMNGKK